MNELGYYVTRIEEEHLWEAKQLGAHSPQVLLNTLVYFNTKYFMLRTVEDHQKLSFTHIMKHWKKAPGQKEGQKSVILRYYPPAKKGRCGVFYIVIFKSFINYNFTTDFKLPSYCILNISYF